MDQQVPMSQSEVPELATSSTTPKSRAPLILGIIAAFLLVGIGSYILVIRSHKKEVIKATSTSRVLTTSIQFSPTTSLPSTEGWKTYANTKYNYSFKYPENWIQTPYKTDSNIAVFSAKKDASYGLPSNGEGMMSVNIVLEKTAFKTPMEWLQNYLDGCKKTPCVGGYLPQFISNLMIGGVPAIKTTANIGEGPVTGVASYYIIYKQNLYEITLETGYGSDTKSDYSALDSKLEGIIPTFKFTN